MFNVGIDGGNNSTILCSDYGVITIPTITTPWRDLDNGLSRGENKIIEKNLDVYIDGVGRYFVGDMAKVVDGTIPTRNMGMRKTGDTELCICILTAIAVQVIKKGLSKAEINMVSGLPISQYKEDRERFAKEFKGERHLKVNGIEVSLNIKQCHVEVEGALNYIIPDNYTENDLVDRSVLGISIGEGDTTILGLSFSDIDGLVKPRYDYNLCWNIDKGIANAKQIVIDEVRKLGTKIDRFDIDRAMFRKARKGEIDLKSGEIYNIIPVYGNALYELNRQLINDINDHIESTGYKGRIKAVYIYGGGGEFMSELFIPKLKGIIKSDIILSKNPKSIIAERYLEKAKSLQRIEV